MESPTRYSGQYTIPPPGQTSGRGARLEHMEGLYRKAFAESNKGGFAPGNVAVQEGSVTQAQTDSVTEQRRQTEEAYARGELTEEEYDAAMDEFDRAEEERIGRSGEKYSFDGSQKDTTQEGGGRMQVRFVNGNQIVWINDNILKENKGQPVHQFIADYIAEHIGEAYTIIESGQKVYIGEDLPGEYTQSKYTQAVLNKNPNIIKAKNRAVGNLGGMIEIASNRRWEKTAHTHNKDAKYGIYRYDTRFGFPRMDSKGDVAGANVYTAELVIRNASDGKKYLYDIVNIRKDTASSGWLTQRVTSAAGKTAGQKGNVSNVSIAEPNADVNSQFSFSGSSIYDGNDVSYIDAVKRGDMKTAQRIVDDAAKAAGYTIKAYHGTSDNFWTFQKGHKRTRGSLNFGSGFYFSPDRTLAENYTNTGRVIDGYLKLDNPYIVYGTRFDQSDLNRISLELGKEVTIDNVTQALQNAGYDGIIAKTYNGTTNPVNQYVVFDANQIKSADSVTYDGDGNVIPLSERFNEKKSDIRYSFSSPKVKEQGRPLEGWYDSDEKQLQAQKAGYPVLKGEQVVPYATWVRSEERGNYGLVTGKTDDGRLLVSFHNKHDGSMVWDRKNRSPELGKIEPHRVSGAVHICFWNTKYGATA